MTKHGRKKLVKNLQHKRKLKKGWLLRKPTFREKCYRFKYEIYFLVIFLVLLGVYFHFSKKINNPRKDKAKEVQESIKISDEESKRWGERYDYGYRIIALEKEAVYFIGEDSIDRYFDAEWNKIRFGFIDADPVKQTDPKIKIELNVKKYEYVNPNSISVGAVLVRQKGTAGVMYKFQDRILEVVLLEDFGDRIYLLFGIKSTQPAKSSLRL